MLNCHEPLLTSWYFIICIFENVNVFELYLSECYLSSVKDGTE